MVSHNAIEIGIRWLTLSFYEPIFFLYLFREFRMNQVSVSNSLKVNYLLREWTMHLLLKYYLFRKFIKDPLFVSRIHHESPLSVSLWIYYLFAISQIISFYRFEFTIWYLKFTICSWISKEFTICSEDSLWNYYIFHGFTIYSLSILRIYYEFTTD